jgi:hypothetical protein
VDLKREVGWEGVDWIYLAEVMDDCHAVVNTVMNHRVSYKARNFLVN